MISEEWTQCQECDFALSEECFFWKLEYLCFFSPCRVSLTSEDGGNGKPEVDIGRLQSALSGEVKLLLVHKNIQTN